MIISIDAEKSSERIQCLFMIRSLRKVVTEGKFLNMIKVSEKPASKSVAYLRL